jgi:hypothetical protein
LLQVCSESILGSASSPALDDAGRPLVGVVVDILHDACRYDDFNLCDSESDGKQTSASVLAVSMPKLPLSVSREDSDTSLREGQSPKEPQKETERTGVMFKPALVARLGAVARKLLEVVDVIQRSSSAALSQFTEIWKIQWHFEATMFIENRLEMQDTNTYFSIAACNRSSFTHLAVVAVALAPSLPHTFTPSHPLFHPSLYLPLFFNSIYYVVVGDALRPAPSSPRDHLFIEMLQSLWYTPLS